jgi:hypothetical protein
VHPENQNAGEGDAYLVRLVYVIEQAQLTKEFAQRLLVTCKNLRLVTKVEEDRQKFSHKGREIPSHGFCRDGIGTDQRLAELHPQQVITLAMLHAQNPGAQAAVDCGKRG